MCCCVSSLSRRAPYHRNWRSWTTVSFDISFFRTFQKLSRRVKETIFHSKFNKLNSHHSFDICLIRTFSKWNIMLHYVHTKYRSNPTFWKTASDMKRPLVSTSMFNRYQCLHLVRRLGQCVKSVAGEIQWATGMTVINCKLWKNPFYRREIVKIRIRGW